MSGPSISTMRLEMIAFAFEIGICETQIIVSDAQIIVSDAQIIVSDAQITVSSSQIIISEGPSGIHSLVWF